MDIAEERALALSRQLADVLRERQWTCATAESCTGGLIGSYITALAGSSDYFQGGIISYTNDAKARLLHVPQTTLDTVGAVSPACAAAMATGARTTLGSHVGIASTGIAGPSGGTARKPVGLVYIAVSTPFDTAVRELRLDGDRTGNIRDSAIAALELALESMQQINDQ